MKWDVSTIDQYIQHREYIDTAIIPIVRVEMGERTVSAVQNAAWITTLSSALEEKLKGRVMLFPLFTYTGEEETGAFMSNLHAYAQHLHKENFTHVVGLALRDRWHESIDPELIQMITVRSLSSEQSDSAQQIHKEVQNLLSILVDLWK